MIYDKRRPQDAQAGEAIYLTPSRFNKLNKINQAMAEGAITIRQIAKKIGASYSYTNTLVRNYKIKVKYERRRQPREFKRVSERDELIQQGLSQVEIAEREKVSKEAIRQYLHASDQYNLWKQKRKEKQEEPRRRDVLVGSIVSAVISRKIEEEISEDKREAYALAIRYIHKRPKVTKSLDDYAELLRRYLGAKNDGCKMSLEQLSDGLPIFFTQAGRILHDLGLEPLYGSREMHITPKEKKEAIKRAGKTKMSCSDIAYFLGLSPHVVSQNRRDWELKPLDGREIKRFGRKTLLSYSLASQVYESADLGFNADETTELLDIDKRAVEYILQNRKDIEKRIISGLRVLYPNQKINKPYLKQES